MKKVLKYIFRIFLVLISTLIMIFVFLFLSFKIICSDVSPTAKNIFATTILETGQFKFLASWFLTKEEIQNVIDKNSFKEMNLEVDEKLIDLNNIATKSEAKNTGYRIEKISGTTYMGKVLIIDDPSKIFVGTTYPFEEYGKELGEIVNKYEGIAGVNGGLYKSDLNKGGMPLGVVVSNGEIQYNSNLWMNGLYLIGFDETNILRIIDLQGLTEEDVVNLVQEQKIRDAVCFQEERSDVNNHFVKVIINGKERELDGMGSGANPRTVIGQRKDGSVVFFVTDGRGRDGHLGATLKDLIKVMKEYDVVNAANLDGGSSSSMFVDGTYEMTSVTLYSANSSWKMPAAFIVK